MLLEIAHSSAAFDGPSKYLLIAGILSLYLAWITTYRLFLSPVAKFPGPKLAGLTFWYEFYYDVICRGSYFREIERMHRLYGPIVRINPYELHVIDPTFYPILYSGPTKKRDKWSWAAKMFGNRTSTFATVSHDHHRLRRSALNPLFSKKSINNQIPMIQGQLSILTHRLDSFCVSGKVLDIGLVFAVFAADVIATYAFGHSMELLQEEDFARDWVASVAAPSELGHLIKQAPWLVGLVRVLPRPVAKVIAPAFSLLLDVQDRMDRQMTSLASKHEKHPLSEGPINVFDSLMHSKLPPSEKTVQRLKGEGQILIGAGTLTTANLLKVLFYHLLCRPDIFQKIRDEIDHAFPNPESPFELSRLETLPWLEASVKEALRLNYGVTHRLQLIAPQESLFFQEWEIPAGTPVGMTSVFMHDNSWVFPEPRCFKPERWMNPEIRPYLTENFVPFSKGTRMCLGQHLAYTEIYLVSATLIRRYDMQLFEVSHDDIEMKHDFFDPYPKLDSKGLRVVMSRRA